VAIRLPHGPADRGSWWHPWLDLVAAARQRRHRPSGEDVSEPVSEYIRFEYDITFRNIAAGEDVR
jgi:hypothetical protein